MFVNTARRTWVAFFMPYFFAPAPNARDNYAHVALMRHSEVEVWIV